MLIGLLSDFPCFNRIILNSLVEITLGITTCIAAVLEDELVLFFYASVLGICTGSNFKLS